MSWNLAAVKCEFHPRTGHEGPEGELRFSSSLSLISALHGSGWSVPRPGRFTPRKDPVPILQEAGWAPGPVWTGAENLIPTGILSPHRPARNKSLYRLRYPNWAAVVSGEHWNFGGGGGGG